MKLSPALVIVVQLHCYSDVVRLIRLLIARALFLSPSLSVSLSIGGSELENRLVSMQFNQL